LAKLHTNGKQQIPEISGWQNCIPMENSRYLKSAVGKTAYQWKTADT
jgi:hypothetical protein